MKRKVYILEGLDCANCAAKIENKLSKMPGLSDVSVTYATKQLRFSAEDPDALLPQIREVVKSMEPDVEVAERTRGGKRAQASLTRQPGARPAMRKTQPTGCLASQKPCFPLATESINTSENDGKTARSKV